MEFNVYGQKVKVEKVKNLDEQHNACGAYNPLTKTILIDTRLKKDDLIVTYLHEIIHAMADRLGYSNTGVSFDMEEMIADNIAVMLVENFDIKIKCKKKNAK